MSRAISDADIDAALARADQFEARFRVLLEFGLFSKDATTAAATPVLGFLTEGRKLARDAKVDEAAEKLDHAELALQKALQARCWLWRYWHIHQCGIFIYHVAAIFILLNIAAGHCQTIAASVFPQIPVPMAVLVAGGLGAALRGMWYLWLQVAKGIFRPQFTIAQLAAPWIGMMFGLFTFLLLKASLLVIKDGDAVQAENAALPLALAFLAGYSWEWILARIEQVRAASGGAAAAPPNSSPQGQKPGSDKPAANKETPPTPGAPQ